MYLVLLIIALVENCSILVFLLIKVVYYCISFNILHLYIVYSVIWKQLLETGQITALLSRYV